MWQPCEVFDVNQGKMLSNSHPTHWILFFSEEIKAHQTSKKDNDNYKFPHVYLTVIMLCRHAKLLHRKMFLKQVWQDLCTWLSPIPPHLLGQSFCKSHKPIIYWRRRRGWGVEFHFTDQCISVTGTKFDFSKILFVNKQSNVVMWIMHILHTVFEAIHSKSQIN